MFSICSYVGLNPMSENTKKEMQFTLLDVKEKPNRAYKKGSKYDGILDSFNSSKSNLVKVELKDTESNYLRTQLHKRITSRKLSLVKVSVINDIVYLEKIKIVPLKV